LGWEAINVDLEASNSKPSEILFPRVLSLIWAC
jgi:hypothetical protein